MYGSLVLLICLFVCSSESRDTPIDEAPHRSTEDPAASTTLSSTNTFSTDRFHGSHPEEEEGKEEKEGRRGTPLRSGGQTERHCHSVLRRSPSMEAEAGSKTGKPPHND